MAQRRGRGGGEKCRRGPGERMHVATVTSGNFNSGWTLRVENSLANTFYTTGINNAGTSGFADPSPSQPSLPSTGTYYVEVDPARTGTGMADVTLFEFQDQTAAATINGSAVPLSFTNQGQNGYVTFSGTSGQQVTIRMTGNTIGWTSVTLRKPDGSYVTGTGGSSASFNTSTVTLGSTGTYKIIVDPSSTLTGSINVAVTSP